MNKRLFFIFFSMILLVLANSESSYSQLLEDRNKLKTAKRDRKPFSPFKNNVKKPSRTRARPEVQKARDPRTTKDIAGRGSDIKRSPRYSQEKAGQQGKRYVVQPRISQEKAGQQGGKFYGPRYTQENAGQQGKRVINPRFSQNMGWEKDKRGAPRFTQQPAGQGYDNMKVNPRFSVQDKGGNKKVRPRFSSPPAYVSNPASGQKRGFLPTIQLFQPKQRYKQGKESNYFGPSVAIVYTQSNSMAKHNQNIQSYQKYIAKGGKKSPYHDQTNHLTKTKRMKKARNSHPSGNYLSAKYNNSSTIRNSKRKFNVVWVRTFGNKTQPKGVKKKPGKSKFDKEEKDIWNNEEREYTRN